MSAIPGHENDQETSLANQPLVTMTSDATDGSNGGGGSTGDGGAAGGTGASGGAGGLGDAGNDGLSEGGNDGLGEGGDDGDVAGGGGGGKGGGPNGEGGEVGGDKGGRVGGGGDGAVTMTVWTLAVSTCSTVTPRADEATAGSDRSDRVLSAVAASSDDGMSMVAVTRTLAASTVTSILSGCTSNVLARLLA